MSTSLETAQSPVRTRRRPLRATAFAVAATAALLVAGCSTGGDDSADGTTTTSADGATSTTGDSTETTTDDGTTTTEGSDAEVTTADLEALLPEAADIGSDYSDVTDEQDEDEDDDEDDGDDSDMDAALEQACPEASEFFRDEDEDESDAAIRVFEAADGREIEVKLDPTPNPNFGEDVMAGIIDAVNSCSTIEVEQDGFTMAIELEASADDTNGDRGVTMAMDAHMTHPQLTAPLELHYSARSYVLGSVSVSLSASDGVAGQTNADIEVVPGDHDLLELLAEQLETGVADVQR